MLLQRLFLVPVALYVAWLCLAYEYHFIDGVNLLFHEGGHVIFGLLGERWRALDSDAKAAWNAKAKAAATSAAAAAASSGASSAAVVAVPAPAATVARGKSAASSDSQQLFDAAAFAEDGEESDDCELPW